MLGFLTLIMPFLGFPRNWKDFFYFAAGLAIAILSYLIQRNETHEDTSENGL